MSPSRVLNLYCIVSFGLGVALTLFLAHCVSTKDVGPRGAAVIILSFNVLLIMVLPLALDWAERRYFKARFLALEDMQKTSPDLASALEEQCKRLSIPKLRLAIVESTTEEIFSYGLWRTNPRLVLPNSLLTEERRMRMIPSIEAELARFAGQDLTRVFLIFVVIEEILQIALCKYHLIA
jgi:hypothetical protein